MLLMRSNEVQAFHKLKVVSLTPLMLRKKNNLKYISGNSSRLMSLYNLNFSFIFRKMEMILSRGFSLL